MFESIKIAPSILSADFMNMQRDIHMLEEANAGYIHVDVMDGHFVPNLTVGVPFVKQLKKITSVPLDVHLMIDNPLYQLPWFIEAEPDLITIHLEALNESSDEVFEALELIKKAGVGASLSIKPDTPTAQLAPYVSDVDMILIMSVYPGFSGQSYIQGSEKRVVEIVEYARSAHVSPLIQVDGGIDIDTTALVCAQGADVLVAGNAIFGAQDKEKAIADIARVGHEAQIAAQR